MNIVVNIIVIFLLVVIFLLNKKSKAVRRFIVLLCIISLVVAFSFPYIKIAYNDRPRHLSVKTSGIYSMDLEKDYYTIKQLFKVNNLAKIADFELNFEKNGNIKDMSYIFIVQESKGYILYKVNYDIKKQTYKIKKCKSREWLQYEEQVDEVLFFKYLNSLNLNKLIKKDYPYYTFSCSGQYISWEIKDWENYKISSGGALKKVKNEELPIKGYAFFFHGNKKTGLSRYTWDNNKSYFFY